MVNSAAVEGNPIELEEGAGVGTGEETPAIPAAEVTAGAAVKVTARDIWRKAAKMDVRRSLRSFGDTASDTQTEQSETNS